MKKIFPAVLMAVFCLPAFAENNKKILPAFAERFELKTIENSADSSLDHSDTVGLPSKGELVIVDRKIRNHISAEIFIEHLSKFYDEDLDHSYMKESCNGKLLEDPREIKGFPKMASELKQRISRGGLLTDRLPMVLEKVSELVTNHVRMENYPVVANISDPNHFLKKGVATHILRRAVGKVIGTLVGELDPTKTIKLIRQFSSMYVEKVIENKRYSQGILRYFLENYEPEQLGLTEDQRNRALSSLEESDIELDLSAIDGDVELSDLKDLKDNVKELKEHKEIRENFETYGLEKMNKRKASISSKVSKTLDMNETLFTVTKQLTGQFAEINFNGSPMIVNLAVVEKRDLEQPCLEYRYKSYYQAGSAIKRRKKYCASFDDTKPTEARIPSLAMDNSCSDYVFKKRYSTDLAMLTKKSSILPGIARSVLYIRMKGKKFKSLKFKHEVQAEAELYGHFMVTGNVKAMETLRKQSLNPFLP